ncbi:hypothetical protein ACFE04_006101 [Oxalis oulophora]
MLVLDKNAKRQRRPNVRLGEVGDVPAAYACAFSHKRSKNLGQKRLKSDFIFPTETKDATTDTSSELLVLNPSHTENNNPNSANLVALNETLHVANPKLDFDALTRKIRGMKRRRTPRGNNGGRAWFSKLSHEFYSEGGHDRRQEESRAKFKPTISDENIYAADGFEDSADHENLGMSKQASEYDTDDVWKNGNSDYVGNTDAIRFGGGRDVNVVRRWLEKRGFGKYADLFELHEVDKEALPLLTIEDLKEMGLFAVGSRRKLFCAIQKLSGSDL